MLRLYCVSAVALCLLSVDMLPAQVSGREVVSGNSTIQLRIEAEGSSGADPGRRIQADVQQWAQTLGAVKPGSQPQTKAGAEGTASVWTVQFATDPKTLHVFMTLDRSSAVCHVSAPAGFKTMFSIQGTLQRCMTELRAAAPNTTVAAASAPATSSATPGAGTSAASPQLPARDRTTASQRPVRPGAPPPAASADQPPAHPEVWASVADVLFRTTYTGGVGGMLVVDYEPVILFKDGTYFEIASQALEDVDLVAEKQARPVHWGTWSQQGITYILTDNRGRPHDYKLQDGNLFKAFDAAAGAPLNMRYKRVSGGGNAALGGDISILVQSNMNFAPDGRFSSGHEMGMINSGNSTGVSQAGGSNRRNGVGTYSVSHHTIELHYPDGRSERKFFAYASAHTPAALDREMIFIGDTPYIHDK